MDIISYDDFAKLDIRIGTIVAVAIVPEADKLLQLTVDVGETDEIGTPITRQIVSGIREFFTDPQELVGTQCPFLVNLKPRMIRGLESQGMILAIGDGAEFSLLRPASERSPGSQVH